MFIKGKALHKGVQPSLGNKAMLWEVDVDVIVKRARRPRKHKYQKVLSLKVTLKCCEWDSDTMGGGDMDLKYETKYQAFKLS